MQQATVAIWYAKEQETNWKLERDDDIHSSDTVQEKLSLVYRFGVRIYFGAPDRKEFHTIVKTLADRNGIQMPEEKLLAEAGKWEISHGGLTGRTAQQFIDHLLGNRKSNSIIQTGRSMGYGSYNFCSD